MAGKTWYLMLFILAFLVIGFIYATTMVDVEWIPVKEVDDSAVEEYRGYYHTWHFPRYHYRPFWGSRYWTRYSYGYPWYWRSFRYAPFRRRYRRWMRW